MGKNKVTALITVFLTFILFIILQPGDDPLALIRIASIVAAVVIVLLVVYTHFLWRLEPFKRFHHVVDINGKWVGKMPCGETIVDVEIRIKQYYDDVNVDIFTDGNRGESMVTSIVDNNDGYKLYIIYKLKPNKVDDKEQIDFGTIILSLDEDVLEGQIFTSKNMDGHIEFYRKD